MHARRSPRQQAAPSAHSPNWGLLLTLLVLSVSAMVLVGVALMQRMNASEQEAAATATAAAHATEQALDGMRWAAAGHLAELALAHDPADERMRLLLALEAYRLTQDMTQAPPAAVQQALWQVLANHNVRPLNSQVSFLTPIKTQSIAQGAMSQSGAWMLTQDGDRRALLWRLPAAATEPPPRPLELPGKVIAKAAFGPAERWLVTLTEDGSGYLWDLSRPPVTEPAQALARQGAFHQAQFDANGRWLAAHEENGRQVRVWALPDGNALPAAPRLLPPEAGEDHPVVTAMAFDHAGRWLATGRDDGKLALWNLTALDAGAASRPVILAGARGRVTAVHFTPDGARLLAAIALNGGEENYFLWPLTLPRLAQQACAQLNGRSFSPAEWETYFPTRPYRETCPVE